MKPSCLQSHTCSLQNLGLGMGLGENVTSHSAGGKPGFPPVVVSRVFVNYYKLDGLKQKNIYPLMDD